MDDYPADGRPGCDGRLALRAEQMTTRAGVSRSFPHGSSLLEALAGWVCCQEIVRQVCYRQADPLAERHEADPSPEVGPFRRAAGQMEFQTDATKVNTTDGWRDMNADFRGA